MISASSMNTRTDGHLDMNRLGVRLTALQPRGGKRPDVSIVIPVNAQGDIAGVLATLTDIAAYSGGNSVEVILVINNYLPPLSVPDLSGFEALGVRIISLPSVRRPDRPGEAVCLSARIPGVRAARADYVVLFDADCRIPNITELLDWYLKQFHRGATAAYTAVHYYDLQPTLAVRTKIAIHHVSRWGKRSIWRIPTTRGSNYAIQQAVMLDLYDDGVLADDCNVGPACKALKGQVAYSGRKSLRVYTSGRMFRAGWRRIVPYFFYRLRYNLRVLPVRSDAQRYTLREKKDPVDRYTKIDSCDIP
jgi:hypothetical protein